MSTVVELEKQKADMLAAIEGWSAERLAYRPAPGEWSTTEMLDHIAKVESGVLAAARRGVQHPHRIGVQDRLGFVFIERIFRSDRRVKVPASAPQVLPETNPDLNTVLMRWRHTRADLTQFVGQLSPAQRRIGIFRHPVSGWMNMPKIITFFSAHILHHGFQLARLRAASEGL